MAEVQYIIGTPEELRGLSAFVKAGTVELVAKVWSSARRSNGGHSAWDGKVSVVFSGTGHSRLAEVRRVTDYHKTATIATLKYAPSKAWCEGNLKRKE